MPLAPSHEFIRNQQKNPRHAAPLDQIHPCNERLRLEKINRDPPRQITAQKNSEARSLGGESSGFLEVTFGMIEVMP